jgi:hypothetical protein
VTQHSKRPRGGQPKPASLRKRHNQTFRIRDQLKTKLATAAEANRRSVSEEIEHRLELSFVYEATLGDVEDFKRRSMAAEAHRQGYGTIHAHEGDRYLTPGSHNLPPSGFIPAQGAAAPQPAYGLPPAVRDAIRDEIRSVLAEAGLLERKGAA